MIETFLDGRVIVKVGDITEEVADAIVNAANSTLLGGGGVDGAIHIKGGPRILEECRIIRQTHYAGGLPTGSAVITTAGNLPARYVIHTVGPIYGENSGRDAEMLLNSYLNSLELAAAHELRTIAFPSISTGAFGYPKHEAAAIVSTALKQYPASNNNVEEIRLVFFSQDDARTFIMHHRF